MISRWSDEEAEKLVEELAPEWGEDLALRTYTSRLLGSERSLVLHGGGNTSVKSVYTDVLGEEVPALFMKASGFDLAHIDPQGLPGLRLESLKRLRQASAFSDDAMVRELRTHLFDSQAASPSIETLVHAFIPHKFVDHTHADAVLALTNQKNGAELVRRVLGDDVAIVNYVKPGFQLAQAVGRWFDGNSGKRGMVWMKHGLATWGDTAREAYEFHLELVTRAEEYLAENVSAHLVVVTSQSEARERWNRFAPLLRGVLSEPTGDPDRPFRTPILRVLDSREALGFVDSPRGKELALSPPLTADHLIRTKAYPLWMDDPVYGEMDAFGKQLRDGVEQYRLKYEEYLDHHWDSAEPGLRKFPSTPRAVMLPGLGIVCAGDGVREADICRDIMAQTVEIKAKIAQLGDYEGLTEAEMFAQEYRGLQHAKLAADKMELGGKTALVTGAAGAIGSGVVRALLRNGCCVALTDLPGERLESLGSELSRDFGNRVLTVPLDVTDKDSVESGMQAVCSAWGGLDFLVVNAGLALVSSLKEMKLQEFRRLERVNVEGTLLLLSAAAAHFEIQAVGGDIVLISTKNVFAPGANFGAYSATKAASHQLARIASLEMAGLGVRVNMVSPDAVFGEGERKSGLWAEVGPDRMRARGLDEKQLQEYYRDRNLLKSRVTAEHVANAVMFFLTRQTPTTGATIPVDGGLPDSTPR